MKVIGPLLLLYFKEKRGSKNFEISGAISKIKAAIQMQLPFTAILHDLLNIGSNQRNSRGSNKFAADCIVKTWPKIK